MGLVVLALFGLVLFDCNGSHEQSSTGTGNGSDSSQACLAEASWFPHSQTPAPNEGPTSPFADPTTTTNCDFHQWAWQKFLFLTRPLSPNSTELNFREYYQVDNKMDTIGRTIILDDTTQAGSHSTLFDKTNRPVYYAVFINKLMYDSASKYVKLFVANCKVSKDSISQAKLDQFGYTNVTFPVGSTEIKTSWVLASSLEPGSLKDYYVTQGKFKRTGKMVDIALVGMHIVGAVENHPELIWATFEHSDLAPYAKWPADFAHDSTPDPNQVLSTSNHLFYKAGLILDSCSVRPYSATQPNPPVPTFRSTYHLYENGTQPKYTNMILRSHDSANLVNTQSINASVLQHLSQEAGPWKNYEYVGSIWIDPTVAKLTPGDANIGGLNRKNLRGARACTNITMETFAQLNWSYPGDGAVDNGNTNPYNSMNCFGCHSTASFLVDPVNGCNYNMALSHLFNNRLATALKKENLNPVFLTHKRPDK